MLIETNDNDRDRQSILIHSNSSKSNIVTNDSRTVEPISITRSKITQFPCKSPQSSGLGRERSISQYIQLVNRVRRRSCKLLHTTLLWYEILQVILFPNMIVDICCLALRSSTNYSRTSPQWKRKSMKIESIFFMSLAFRNLLRIGTLKTSQNLILHIVASRRRESRS